MTLSKTDSNSSVMHLLEIRLEQILKLQQISLKCCALHDCVTVVGGTVSGNKMALQDVLL